MNKYRPVTVSQMECGRKIANEKKVGRALFQRSLEDGLFGRFLDSLKIELADIEPPKGARIYILEVEVDQSREWQAAVDSIGFNNNFSDDNLRKVGDQYIPVSEGRVKEKLLLLNFPNGDGCWDKAIVWAEINGLKRTDPRETFAIGEQHPKLNEKLRQNPMCAIATKDCEFAGEPRLCYVCWSDTGREADLRGVEHFDNVHDWFVFRK